MERGKEEGGRREGEWSAATLYHVLWLSHECTELLTTHNLMQHIPIYGHSDAPPPTSGE